MSSSKRTPPYLKPVTEDDLPPWLKYYHMESFYKRGPDPWLFSSEPQRLDAVITIVNKAIQNALPIKPFETRLLDIGCGEGQVTSRLDAGDIIGVDISATAVERARILCDSLQKNVRFLVGDIQSGVWQFLSDRYFNMVVGSEVFYYLKREAMPYVSEQVARVMARNGLLFLCEGIRSRNFSKTFRQMPGFVLENEGRFKFLRGKLELSTRYMLFRKTL